MISYFLAESSFPGVTGYVARVPTGNHLSATNIMNEVAQRTGMSVVTIQSVFTAYQAELVKSLARGESPEVGDLGYLIMSLRGTFTSPLEVITPQNADFHDSNQVIGTPSAGTGHIPKNHCTCTPTDHYRDCGGDP